MFTFFESNDSSGTTTFSSSFVGNTLFNYTTTIIGFIISIAISLAAMLRDSSLTRFFYSSFVEMFSFYYFQQITPSIVINTIAKFTILYKYPIKKGFVAKILLDQERIYFGRV